MRIRYPPGGSGRLWLEGRLVVAERAGSILHRKQQALRHEEHRLAALAERTAATWTAAVRDAEAWQRRAMILGGRSALRAAVTAANPAGAHLAWRTEMGVEFPGEAGVELALMPPIAGTPALTAAAAAYRHALDAAVEHAAATTALSRVRDELAVTRQRVRAVRDRWIPELQATLRDVELRLDEHEREELTRAGLHHRTIPVAAPSRPEAR